MTMTILTHHRRIGLLLLLIALVIAIANIDAIQTNDPERFDDNFGEACPIVKSENLPITWFYNNNNNNNNNMSNTANKKDVVIKVVVNMTLFRFVEINDLDQRLSLFMDIVIEWQLPCNTTLICQELDFDNANSACPNGQEYDDFSFHWDRTDYWHPALSHLTSISKAWRIMDQMSDSITVFPFLGKARREFRGRVDNACTTFSFAKFPFDTLNCSLMLDSHEQARFIKFEIGSFAIDQSAVDDFIGDTEVWRYNGDRNSSQVRTVAHNDGRDYHRLVFSLVFSRRYDYFVNSTFLPLWALFLLQLATFLMPPRFPDRPTYSMTVVLAFSVVLAMVFGNIPKTSETVYLVNIVAGKLICGVVITVYALATCSIGKDSKTFIVRKTCYGRMTLIRAIDCFVAFIIIFASVTSDIVYLQLMMS